MKLYFRKRKQGAFCFRLDVENRQRRLELIQIATITGKNEIRPHKRNPPTEAETAEIEAWIAEQASGRVKSTAEQAIEDINLITQWIAKEAGDEEVLAHSDPILLAVHDLRHEIVRRLSKVGDKPGGTSRD
ncbi:MAG: hypothetical protein AAFR17_13305 [Pseudomonadota bacterium]